ncbi:MAG: glucose-6-phosphate isomerase [Candidatus Marinimicrobia bacterium]|nr:glucose-6-phosphate isomerase [Candidatus Neomarinimicrobiota bacterium]
MISSSKIIDDLSKQKYSLFKSFFPNSKYNFNLKKIKNFKKFKTVIIIGMGGSILGAHAIYSLLKHKIKKKFIFIDNLDQRLLHTIRKENNLNKALFLIISKSGNTSETIVNSGFFSSFLNTKNTIIISENKNNSLNYFAKNKNIYLIRHDLNIGGRYSIFSDVGMLPVFLMGLKPHQFKKNIPTLINNKRFLSRQIKKILKINLKKIKVMVFLNYIPELQNFMFWCQQLLAESLGKNKKGLTPIVSSGPKDHHSLLQLYLDGPQDKIFYIFSSENEKKLKVKLKLFGKQTKSLDKKKYEKIKLTQKNALITVLKEKRIPFREIKIKKLDEKKIGELFLTFIFETIILAKRLNVNPFDQPAVERVKILTRKFLS